MQGPEPGSARPAIWRQRWWWLAGIVVLAAVAVAVVWMAALPSTHTVRIKPVVKPTPGGDTCYAEPFELTGVRRGDIVVFKNEVPNTTVRITFDVGAVSSAPIEVDPNSSESVPVTSQVGDGTYRYSLSCAPSLFGDARPRIVIRTSTPDS